MVMGVHIIHLYQRSNATPPVGQEQVYGMVDDIEEEMRYPFGSIDELWEILRRLLPAPTETHPIEADEEF